VAVTDGPPHSLFKAHFQDSAPLAASVLGTTDSFRYGPQTRLLRILHVGDQESALQLWQSLRRSLRDAEKDPETPEAVCQFLDDVKCTVVEAQVHIQVALEADRLSREYLDEINRLFQ
jgi:hypothetical protein